MVAAAVVGASDGPPARTVAGQKAGERSPAASVSGSDGSDTEASVDAEEAPPDMKPRDRLRGHHGAGSPQTGQDRQRLRMQRQSQHPQPEKLQPPQQLPQRGRAPSGGRRDVVSDEGGNLEASRSKRGAEDGDAAARRRRRRLDLAASAVVEVERLRARQRALESTVADLQEQLAERKAERLRAVEHLRSCREAETRALDRLRVAALSAADGFGSSKSPSLAAPAAPTPPTARN
eukprot:TRINITY_DN16121_c0_g1_i2.p1 TRINITY_DN16121_c0_g1~~TRINITY_DN16121_c0_g1_i2.p1  ORF type:complete len:247 (+),score=54.71 TRINITY_DN16121_c0_g1_i2:40-741(+)